MPPLDAHALDPLAAAREALAEGRWQAARALFEDALGHGRSPEALEGLGMAARWLGDGADALEAHEEAYRGYRQAGDGLAAARVATALALEYYAFRSEHAVASGWMERAARLLADAAPAAEHGWLALWRGHVDLQVRKDPAASLLRSAEGARIARALGSIDLEMLALAQEGLAMVSEGSVAEGMRRLDEAATAATAGELSDLDAIATVCCYLIDACRRVGDFDRALQWCDHVSGFCQRWGDRMTFSACRVQYADVLIWRGDWPGAERAIAINLEELRALNPAREGDALARLGELRRRQGRLDEAAELFARAERHPVALLGRGELALDRADPAGAIEAAERFLRRLSPESTTERAAGLELLARAQLAAGEPQQAGEVARELRTIADAADTDALRASAALVEGLVAAAAGEPAAAAGRLDAAAELFECAGGPYQAARARIALAGALHELGRLESAAEEAGAARTRLAALGADLDAGRAARLLRELGRDAPAPAAGLAGLTRREIEVLRLIGRGRSNQQIAAELVLSVRTVERHISNIYGKIGATGTAARAAAAAQALREGLS
jgi:DNA-binding CsgD family transcriptional regulator/tetratricopeptide (TPR) repeat protein